MRLPTAGSLPANHIRRDRSTARLPPAPAGRHDQPATPEADMSAGTEGFAHPEFLVESEWLAAHLDDPELRILDCTIHLIANPDIGYTVKLGREDFEKGHIPGAQYIDLQADLSAPHPKLRFMLPGAEDFAAAMGRFGVGDTSRVVLYSTTNPQWATRIWWMLRNYGFDN